MVDSGPICALSFCNTLFEEPVQVRRELVFLIPALANPGQGKANNQNREEEIFTRFYFFIP